MIAWFIGTRVGRWLAAAAGMFVLVGGVLLKAYLAGKQAALSKQRDADLHDTAVRRDIDADVRTASDESLEARARRWM